MLLLVLWIYEFISKFFHFSLYPPCIKCTCRISYHNLSYHVELSSEVSKLIQSYFWYNRIGTFHCQCSSWIIVSRRHKCLVYLAFLNFSNRSSALVHIRRQAVWTEIKYIRHIAVYFLLLQLKDEFIFPWFSWYLASKQLRDELQGKAVCN